MSRINTHKPAALAFVPYTHSAIVIFDGQMYRVCGFYTSYSPSVFNCKEQREEFEITSIKPVVRTHTDDEHVVEFELLEELSALTIANLRALAIVRMREGS